MDNLVENVNNFFKTHFINRAKWRFFDTFFAQKLFPQRFSHFLTELLTSYNFMGQTLRQLKNKKFMKKVIDKRENTYYNISATHLAV